MGKIEVYECDNCGKRCDDIYKEKGWIIIEGRNEISITVTNKRRSDGIAKTFYKNVSPFSLPLIFCSTECLTKFIEKMREENARS